jgi:mono/diheme cytochrome c family protein
MWRPTTFLLLATLLAACSRPDPVADARFFSPEARERGRQAFATYCALCHGVAGDGQGVRRSAFTTPPRDFTDQAWRQSVTPRGVFEKIRDGVPGTAMPAWRALGDETVADLTAYVLAVNTGPPHSAAGNR